MENEPTAGKSIEMTIEPAESFGIEFLNTKSNEVQSALRMMGDFIFRGSGAAGDNEVYFTGERADGTKIRITVTKGDNYKSPAAIAATAEKGETELLENKDDTNS
jgi:hypothetical protein